MRKLDFKGTSSMVLVVEEVKKFFYYLIINDINHYFSCSFSTRHDDYHCHYRFGTFLNLSCSCPSTCLNILKDKEFIFRNLENGISLFNADTLETKLLMDNSSFVSTKILKLNFIEDRGESTDRLKEWESFDE